MKILILNNKEKKDLADLLVKEVRKGCSYPITTVLEKLSIKHYRRAFYVGEQKK